MNKKTFLKYMGVVHEDIISNVYDRLMLAERTGRIVYTNEFYTPDVWKTIESIKNHIGVDVYTYGVFKNAERRIIAFSTGEHPEVYPLHLIKIVLKSRFSEFSHKDYLGSLMSLGVKREKFGDLLLKENGDCYFPCLEDVIDYVQLNLKKIGNSPCEAFLVNPHKEEIPEYNFKSFISIVSSMRLDCIISSICNLSRNKSEILVKQGKVQMDYREIDKKDKIIECGCTLTIRGYGKFKILEKAGCTAKGRVKLAVKKFI